MISNLFVEKYRPKNLDDIILSSENRKIFESFKKAAMIPNIILMGKQGIGKTSLAKIIVKDILGECNYLYINASDENGIDSIRTKINNFAKTASFDGKIKVVILDEADGLTIDAQRALRNIMEEYSDFNRFVLTGNQKNRISAPIKSRCQEFDLTPPLDDCVKRCINILKQEQIKIDDLSRDRFIKMIKFCYPDLRKIINNIQKYTINNVLSIPASVDTQNFSLSILENIINKKDIFEIRRDIIEREIEFGSDYHELLKGLYDATYNCDKLTDKNKCDIMVIIGNYMYKHSIVLDHEINAYSCLLEIKKALNV